MSSALLLTASCQRKLASRFASEESGIPAFAGMTALKEDVSP